MAMLRCHRPALLLQLEHFSPASIDCSIAHTRNSRQRRGLWPNTANHRDSPVGGAGAQVTMASVMRYH